MSEMPEYPLSSDALLQVDRAHKAYELISNEYIAEIDRLNKELAVKFNPSIFAAQSVLYEAMGQASSAGFTYEQMVEVMECDQH